MSLRPRTPGTRTTLAQSRMAPGGRRWSEATIPRVGRRRVRTAKEALPPTFITDAYYSTTTLSYLSVDEGFTTDAGQVLVAFVTAVGTVPTPRTAEWDVLVSGSVGALNYCLAALVLTPDNGISADFDFTLTPDDGTYFARATVWQFTGNATAAAAVTTTPAATQAAMRAPAGSWRNPWNAFAYDPDPSGFYGTDPASLNNDLLLDLDGTIQTGYGAIGGFPPPAAVTGNVTNEYPDGTPDAADWCMAAFGWT